MKAKTMRLLLAVFCIVCLLFTFTGCSSNTGGTEVPDDTSTGTHTVTDNGGNVVEVPNEIKRVVILDISPLPSVYCMLAGSADRIVGMTPSSQSTALHSLLPLAVSGLDNVETSFAQGDTYNTEELLALNPDVIFYRLQTQADVEAISKLDIPAVGFSTAMHEGNTIETLNSWVQLMADVFQEDSISEKAQALIEYGRNVEQEITERVSTLSEDEKVKAMILFNYDSSGIKAAGSTYGRYYLKATGTINVTADLNTAFPQINLEQIYAWDPQVILLNSFSAFTADDIINNTAVEGDDWSGLTAVKNSRVHKYPIGMYHWFPPSSDSPLSLQWTAKCMYPELFKDVDMYELTREYYSQFYGIDLTDAQLESIFNPSADAAWGF